MRFEDVKVTFAEVPDEISLCVNISGCPFRCPDCHSKWLWEDTGEELTEEVLFRLIGKNLGISCICIMGGLEDDVYSLLSKFKGLGLKLAWYSGSEKLPGHSLGAVLDYVKVGPYNSDFGPLTSRTTNQRFYRVDHIGEEEPEITYHDITSRFWK